MDLERPQRVSVIDPISPAIEQVRLMLFRPFDISKWLVIGFCAWLAYLPWIIIGAIIVIPILIIIGLVVCWVSSRGRFMFVHCIAGNKAEVAIPWKKFARQANSLFLFRIVIGLIGMVVVGLPVAIGILAFATMSVTNLVAAAVSGLLVAVLVAVAIAVVVAVVAKFTTDFVVPIMFLRTASCLAGWRQFLALLGSNKASNGALYTLSNRDIAGHIFHYCEHLPRWVLLLLCEHAFISAVRGDGDSIAYFCLQTGLFAFLPAPVRVAI